MKLARSIEDYHVVDRKPDLSAIRFIDTSGEASNAPGMMLREADGAVKPLIFSLVEAEKRGIKTRLPNARGFRAITPVSNGSIRVAPERRNDDRLMLAAEGITNIDYVEIKLDGAEKAAAIETERARFLARLHAAVEKIQEAIKVGLADAKKANTEEIYADQASLARIIKRTDGTDCKPGFMFDIDAINRLIREAAAKGFEVNWQQFARAIELSDGLRAFRSTCTDHGLTNVKRHPHDGRLELCWNVDLSEIVPGAKMDIALTSNGWFYHDVPTEPQPAVRSEARSYGGRSGGGH